MFTAYWNTKNWEQQKSSWKALNEMKKIEH